MKKTIMLGLVSVISSFILVGCGGAEVNNPSYDKVKNEHRVFLDRVLTQQKVHKLILQAGEENGWRMTEFKSNELVAEKMTSDGTISVDIKFDNHSFEIDPENDDLSDILKSVLNK